MRSILRATAFALLLPVVSAVAHAQASIKLAYVNTAALMDAAPGRQAADSALKRESDALTSTLQKLQDSVNAMLTKYQKDEPTLSATAKETRQKAIQALETDLQAKNLKAQQQMSQRQNELTAPMIDAVKKVLDDIRIEDGYTIIFSNDPGQSVIVSADKNLDITDRVDLASSGNEGDDRWTGRRKARRSGQSGRRYEAEAAAAVIPGSSERAGGGEDGFVLTAAAIAEAVGGRVVGDPSATVNGIASLDRASSRDLSFLGVGEVRHALSRVVGRRGVGLSGARGDPGQRARPDHRREAAGGVALAPAAVPSASPCGPRRALDRGDRPRRSIGKAGVGWAVRGHRRRRGDRRLDASSVHIASWGPGSRSGRASTCIRPSRSTAGRESGIGWRSTRAPESAPTASATCSATASI